MTNSVSDNKIQITILILRRGALSRSGGEEKDVCGEGDVIGRSTRARVIDYLGV